MFTIPTFLKWAGGKRKIIKVIEKYFPEKIDRYFEPFLGGGSVFFYIKKKYNPSLCVISDTNKDLIDTYVNIRDNPQLIIKYLSILKKNNSEKSFYSIREEFNNNRIRGVKRSAAFIYLNKTCYNGLYRVNSKNKFNVPYGKFDNPGIYDRGLIYEASSLLKNNVIILNQDYRQILDYAKKNDFIYLDPCYDPIKKTSFANYTPFRFKEKDRNDLFEFIEILKQKKSKVVLSNNDVAEVKNLYKNYTINEIIAGRTINSKPENRGKIKELVITNK